MLKDKKLWIGLAVSLVFLGLFARQLDAERLVGALLVADYRLLLPAVPCYFLGVWFRAVRWRHLLHPLRPLGTGRLFPYVVIGYMANDLLPLRIGELVRANLLGARHGMSKVAVLTTIGLERIFDGLALLAFIAAVALVVPLGGWLEQIARLTGLVFVGAIAALFVLMASRERGMGMLSAVLSRLPAGPRVLSFTGSFYEGIAVLGRPGRVGAVALYSVLAWVSEAGVFYFVGLALGLEAPLFVYFLSMSAGNLGTAMPSSQAGIGPFEYFTAQTFIVFGTGAAQAGAFALLVHGVLLVPVVLLGFVYLWAEGLSLRRLVREASVKNEGGAGPEVTAGLRPRVVEERE